MICLIDDRDMSVTSFSGSSPMNAVSFSPFLTDLMATGHHNGMVKLWDLRYSSRPLFIIHQHKKSQFDDSIDANVNTLQFSPLLPNMLLSSSTDQTVNIYDLSKIESNSNTDNVLYFTHSPHQKQVYEARWNQHTHGIVGSVAEEYGIHVWKFTEQ